MLSTLGSMILGIGDRHTGHGIITTADGTEAGDQVWDGTARAMCMEVMERMSISGTAVRPDCAAPFHLHGRGIPTRQE